MGEDDRPAQSRRRLSDDDIRSVPRVGRRAVLTLAGGAAFAAVVAAEPVSAQTSDNDSGAKADPAGGGPGPATGTKAIDSGPNGGRPPTRPPPTPAPGHPAPAPARAARAR